MKILTAFAPFIAFAVVDRLVGPTEGLAVGTATSAILVARDLLTPKRDVKLLEFATALLFAGLTLFSIFSDSGASSSVIGVRLSVDSGLLLIVLLSLAFRRPFTTQYAREEVPETMWTSPGFIRANYVITSVWAVAFAVMVITEAVMLYVPGVPQRAGVVAIIVAIYGAMKFTAWYPQRARSASEATT
jgi:hypothetical protein